MFNRSQRDVLNKLSETIWNSSSKWQTLFDKGILDIVDSSEEVDEEIEQIQLNNSKKTRGTLYNKTTAKEKGVWSDTPETMKVKKTVKRRPSFEELVHNLTDIARASLYSFMTNEQLLNALAMDLVAGSNVNVKLIKKDDEQSQKDYEDLFNRLPEDLKSKVVDNLNGLPVDAVEFVSELLFVSTHLTDAKNIFEANLNSARLSKEDQTRKHYVQQAFGLRRV